MAAKIPMPPLTILEEALKSREMFIKFMDKIVETIAYWIIQHGDIKTSSGHNVFRERLAAEYPLLNDNCLKVIFVYFCLVCVKYVCLREPRSVF